MMAESWLIAFLVLALVLWVGRNRWRLLLFRRRRVVRGVIVRKEGYIRANVIHGGGGYRIQVLSAGEPLEVMVADHDLYQQLQEGAAWRLRLSADSQRDGWWLRSGRPD